MTSEQVKILYRQLSNYLVIIDSFCFIGDLLVVTWLYFNHFQYNSHGYKLTKSDNIQRIICLIISFIIILSLILRYNIHRKYQNVKFILSLRANIPNQRIKYLKLLVEIICHLLQPIPGVACNFKIDVLGKEVNYSLDMILFTLSILRLFVIFKIIKIYNTYTNSRGQKINSYFGNTMIWTFLYRTNLKNNGFLTIAVIFIIIVFGISYIFKVFENYQTNETTDEFGNYFNCLWFIIQSITILGFGDLTPSTVIGRIISGVMCILGIGIQSLFTVTMLMFIFFIEENEQKAFNEINLLYKKEEKKNNYNIYFNQYIKNKFHKLLQNSQKKDLMTDLNVKNDLKILKEKYYLRILASMKIPLTLNEFSDFVNKQWEPQSVDTIEWYRERVDTFNLYLDFFADNIQQFQLDLINCYCSNTRMVNLVVFIFLCGNIFPLRSYINFKKEKVISIKDFEKFIKQFHLKFFEKKNNFEIDEHNFDKNEKIKIDILFPKDYLLIGNKNEISKLNEEEEEIFDDYDDDNLFSSYNDDNDFLEYNNNSD